MSKINVLSMDIANKIAAGEVVERPASVIKELVENAVDAGSSSITIEIKNGGITYMRVTDNGSGIAHDEVKTAFMRHATSKLSSIEDLEQISSLGFRGEALSSIASVSHIEVMTREKNSNEGFSLKISGGIVESEEVIGCPDGTTILVKDLFFNTPARMKFLKTDKTEGGYISDIMQRLALSKPEIAIKFIVDGKIRLQTSGDKKLTSCIYSIYGKDYVNDIKTVQLTENNVKIDGIIGLPILSRANRRFQSFFVNGRYVKSNTLTFAVEEAFKNKLMVGKFPFFVLNVNLPFGQVDVNVHPSKTEVKFSDEKAIYHAVYWSVYNALMSAQTEPKRAESNPFKASLQEIAPQVQEKIVESPNPIGAKKTSNFSFEMKSLSEAKEIIKELNQTLSMEKVMPNEQQSSYLLKENSLVIETPNATENSYEKLPPNYQIIGQAFETYIIIQLSNELILVDQHAAHERQIYERLVNEKSISPQIMLIPVSILLSGSEFAVITENLSFFDNLGFELEEFGNNSIVIRQTPVDLPQDELKNLLIEIAENINSGKRFVQSDRQDRALYTIACKAAIKANKALTDGEMRVLVNWVLSQSGVDTCPHGRPLTYKFTKNDIEKLFKRV